jgi:O-antigen/teichoic acid export membrane protein
MLSTTQPRSRTASPSLLSDLGTSVTSQVVVVIGNIATLGLAAQAMDATEVGAFALVRRVVAFLAPLLLLGLGVGMPRYLGRETDDPVRRTAFVLAGWLLVLPVTIAAATFLVCRPEAAAKLFFGTDSAAHLAQPLALLVVGNQIFLLAYAILRGELRIRLANVLQSVQIGVLPLLATWTLGRHGARTTLLGIGVVSVLLALGAAITLVAQALSHVRRAAILPALRALSGYGLARVPGDLAVAGLYALGPILAAHTLDLRAAGLLAVGLSLVTALAAAFTPLGLVLLPRLSGQLAGPHASRVRAQLPHLVGSAIHLACFLGVTSLLFGNDLLGLFLGPSFSFPNLVFGLLVVGAAGNVLFVVLRSVLDADTAVPLNAMHAMAALAVMVAVWGALQRIGGVDPLVGVSAAVGISLLTLGWLTVAAVVRRFGVNWGSRAIGRGLATVAILAATGLGLRHAWPASDGLSIAVQLLLIVTVWFVALYSLRVGWLLEITAVARAWRRDRVSASQVVPNGATMVELGRLEQAEFATSARVRSGSSVPDAD